MIVIKRKPLEEVLSYIEGHDKILVLGCQKCPYGCATGGEDAVKRLAEEIKNKMIDLGKSIEILEKTLIRLCDLLLTIVSCAIIPPGRIAYCVLRNGIRNTQYVFQVLPCVQL